MTRRLPIVLWVVAVACVVPATVVNALLDYPAAIDLVGASASRC